MDEQVGPCYTPVHPALDASALAAARGPFNGCPERYIKGSRLGGGSFGEVYSAYDTKDKEHVAIKFLDVRIFLKAESRKYLRREIFNHRGLIHPHVIKFKEVFKAQRHVGIVMELANFVPLISLLRCARQAKIFNENLARWIFQQLVLAVDYCHQKGIANRDLKLENLMTHYDPDTSHTTHLPVLKLCDFGYSKSDAHSAAKTYAGTVYYMAPEVLTGSSYDAKKADVWSCGVILYHMLFDRFPFNGSTHSEKCDDITYGRFMLPAHQAVSRDCIHLLSLMLAKRPEERVTLQQVQAHPWFLAGNPTNLTAWNREIIEKVPLEGELQCPNDIDQVLDSVWQQVNSSV